MLTSSNILLTIGVIYLCYIFVADSEPLGDKTDYMDQGTAAEVLESKLNRANLGLSNKVRQRQQRLAQKPCGLYCSTRKRSEAVAIEPDEPIELSTSGRMTREWYNKALQNCKPYCNWLKRGSRSALCKLNFTCDLERNVGELTRDVDDGDDSSLGRRALIGLPYCLPLCQTARG